VFGDGSLSLASTPGHTAGHLSLIVRTGGREILLTADAAYTMATIRHGQRPWLTHDSVAFEHNLSQIQAYNRQNPDALIIPGHDMQAWQELRTHVLRAAAARTLPSTSYFIPGRGACFKPRSYRIIARRRPEPTENLRKRGS
jgi:glyoxylase-like metal-dependent hydrolase (beta-lactamase superfamily II)